MTGTAPDWELLPGDPLAFFGLSPEFSRKDLKRAYTKLIRVFKPETNPAEFQRIRGAYDLLDERSRYMDGMSTLASNLSDLGSTARPPSETKPELGTDCVTLLSEEGAAGARLALRAKKDLRAEDWCRLALIEEIVEEDSLALCRTLIEAIIETGGAQENFQFLRAIIHEGLAPRDAAVLVQELVKLVESRSAPLPAGAYWFLSEPLWILLVRKLKFSSFSELLERCTIRVGEEGWSGRLVLLTTLIRRAMLRADQAWIDEVWEELTGAFNKLSPWHQADVDLIGWMLEYREGRENFRRPIEMRETMDRALVAIVEGDDESADRAFLEAQVACLDRREELFEAFPFRERAGIGVGILLWYADEVASRRGDFHEREPESRESKRVIEFTHRVLRRSNRNWTFRTKELVVGWGILFMFFIAWGLLSLALSAVPVIGENRWIPGILMLALALIGFRRGWIGRAIMFAEAPFLRRVYRTLWRDLTVEFLTESHIPLGDVLSYISMIEKKDSDLDDYITLVAEDEALFLYSTALRFAE